MHHSHLSGRLPRLTRAVRSSCRFHSLSLACDISVAVFSYYLNLGTCGADFGAFYIFSLCVSCAARSTENRRWARYVGNYQISEGAQLTELERARRRSPLRHDHQHHQATTPPTLTPLDTAASHVESAAAQQRKILVRSFIHVVYWVSHWSL